MIVTMGLGQSNNNSLGEYCDPHIASSVFFILIPTLETEMGSFMYLDHQYTLVYYFKQKQMYRVITQIVIGPTNYQGHIYLSPSAFYRVHYNSLPLIIIMAIAILYV